MTHIKNKLVGFNILVHNFCEKKRIDEAAMDDKQRGGVHFLRSELSEAPNSSSWYEIRYSTYINIIVLLKGYMGDCVKCLLTLFGQEYGKIIYISKIMVTIKERELIVETVDESWGYWLCYLY